MRWRALSVVFLLLLSACDRPRNEPRAYKHWTDQWIVRLRLPNVGIRPCAQGVAVDQCYRMEPARRWKGLWRNEFEGSQFCAAPARECSFEKPGEQVWLDFSFSFPTELKDMPFGGLYEVDFIGRRTAFPGSYGHMGAFDCEIIADRMISIREVEAPPKE